MTWEELKVALATLQAAPSQWIDGVRESVADAAQWIWEVLQGDFNESEQSTAQLATGMVISMVPGVDQICDIRDLVANCKKINHEPSNSGYWFALCLTLVGLFPTLGSLLKGCIKIIVGYVRKGIGKTLNPAEKVWESLMPFVEQGIQKLNVHLNSGPVRKALAAIKVISPYGWLANKTRELAKSVSVSQLLSVFDELHAALKKLLGYVQDWGGAVLQGKAGQLLQAVQAVRNRADAALGKVVAPLQTWLNKLAKRLDEEEAKAFKAVTNRHNVAQLSNQAEKEAFDKAKPKWVSKGAEELKYPGQEALPAEAEQLFKQGYPKNLSKEFNNFHDGSIQPAEYPPGTVLYRVVDPTDRSFDNGAWWMTEADFRALTGKDDWRKRCAVWQSWNGNGEYVTYVVPPGRPLKGWSGTAASQLHEVDKTYSLEGGAHQILLDPADLQKRGMQKREPTNWGYDLDQQGNPKLIGVPVLQSNWREPRSN